MNTKDDTPPADFTLKLAQAIQALERIRDNAFWDEALMHLAHMAKTAPLILSALASRDVVDMVLAISDGPTCYGILNRRIGWLRDRYLQLQFVGQTLDYTGLAAGAVTVFGAVMETCPKCGRSGTKHTGAPGLAQYTHIETIDDWIMSTAVAACLVVDVPATADDAPPSPDGL